MSGEWKAPATSQLYLPPTHTLRDFLERILLPGDDGLARRVEVRRNDDTVRPLRRRWRPHQGRRRSGRPSPQGSPLEASFIRRSLSATSRTPSVEPEAPRSVGRCVLAERVAGHHVRLDPRLAANGREDPRSSRIRRAGKARLRRRRRRARPRVRRRRSPRLRYPARGRPRPALSRRPAN